MGLSFGDEYGVPRKLRGKYEAAAKITDEFCNEYLNGNTRLCPE